MLRGLLLLALAVTTAACGTRQARTGETGRKGRIIAVTDTILDTGGTDTVRFGRMHSGEVAVLRLWIENRASKPVAITRYDRNCGCTTLGYDAQPITPGDAQRDIAVHLDQQGRLLDLFYRTVNAAGGNDLVTFFQAFAECLHLLAALGFGAPHEEP